MEIRVVWHAQQGEKLDVRETSVTVLDRVVHDAAIMRNIAAINYTFPAIANNESKALDRRCKAARPTKVQYLTRHRTHRGVQVRSLRDHCRISEWDRPRPGPGPRNIGLKSLRIHDNHHGRFR